METQVPPRRKLYLAAPFFTPTQLERVNAIENLCEGFNIECFSPRKFMILKPMASEQEREAVFNDNLTKIGYADLVLAIVDDPDTGTHWEMGYARGIMTPVVAVCLSSRKINVMLAQSCVGVLNSIEEVEIFLKGDSAGDFAWAATTKWNKEIF